MSTRFLIAKTAAAVRAHWGVLALGAASVVPFAGWVAARLVGWALPGASCVPVAACAVCGVALCACELSGIADAVREMGGGDGE